MIPFLGHEGVWETPHLPVKPKSFSICSVSISCDLGALLFQTLPKLLSNKWCQSHEILLGVRISVGS